MTYIELQEHYYNLETPAKRKAFMASMTVAQRIAWQILDDVTDRRGWRQEWDQFDDDVKDDIFTSFTKIITENMPTSL